MKNSKSKHSVLPPYDPDNNAQNDESQKDDGLILLEYSRRDVLIHCDESYMAELPMDLEDLLRKGTATGEPVLAKDKAPIKERTRVHKLQK